MNTPFASYENRRCLLVDDSAEILALLATLLENFTAAKIECHRSPQSALVAFAKAPENYELVITDFEMPGMDGVELCRRLHAIAPAQKIFLVTGNGYFTESAAQRAGFCTLLNKPFRPADLRAALAAAGFDRETAGAA